MFENVIIEQNPHWTGKQVFDGVKREKFQKLISLMDTNQIITITGIRRCGKSTIIKELIQCLISEKKVNPKNIFFLNLEQPIFDRYKDNPEYLNKILEDYLKITLPEDKIYIFLDEIQFFKNWQVFIKSKYEQKKFKFVITGSNSKLLSSEMITLLSGRTIGLKLFPFNFKEILLSKNIEINKISIISKKIEIMNYFDNYLKNGGFPEITLLPKEELKKEILTDYAKNIIYQDIIPRFSIKKSKDIETLFYYLISNITKPYSYNSLSKIINISDKTIKEYIKYFEDSFLLTEIEKYNDSLKKQIKSAKKIYFIDTGMINAFSFSISPDRGRLLENLVFYELKKREKTIYYYSEEKECDFVIKEGIKIVSAIQVADNLFDEKTKKREIEGLINAMKKFNLTNGLILTYEEENEIIIDKLKIQIKPIWKWMIEDF